MPCTSGIRPSWILHAIKQGFDGVFIASDGDECALLPDCAKRASRIMAEAQTLLKAEGLSGPATEDGRDLLGLRGELRQAHEPILGGPDRDAAEAGSQLMTDYDALVVGSGIAGMESALKLGDMGYKVLLVEKEASVGGRMILLSKVFPTLDCASCISTPKMAASIHHPNVTAMTYTEVDGISRDGDGIFKATIRQKPRFVDEAACTGCQLCETACTVAVPDQFNADMVARRAAYIAFPQAVPKKAVLERAGTSPCSYTCPAGIKAHGYVSLIRSGEYEKALPARAGGHAAGRYARSRLLRPVRGRVHPRLTRGHAPDPPAQALRRGPPLRRRPTNPASRSPPPTARRLRSSAAGRPA